MGSVNAVGSVSSDSSEEKLLKQYLAQLQQKGLSTSGITTVSQAQAALAATGNANATDGSNKSSFEEHKSGGGSGSSIKTELQGIASELGVSVSSDAKPDEVISSIESALTSQMSAAQSSNNKSEINKLNVISQELTAINNEISEHKAQAKAASGMTGQSYVAALNQSAIKSGS